ncbi:MAG: hypothetical protein HY711_08825 [Candidatus Melainabacteria bacterium]|nr:hypothetical protein [Candidatus Melainabacteria bacterium]
MIPLDPVTIAAAAGAATAVTSFFLGRRSARPKDATKRAYSKQEQAIGEVELIEALSALRLPPETARMLKEKVRTLQELEDAVAMIRGGAIRSVTEKMFPCAVAYAGQHRGTEADLIAKALVIAQCNAPHGVVHPAFAAIASDILVAGESFVEVMRGTIRKIEDSTQSGLWIDWKLQQEGWRSDRRHRLFSHLDGPYRCNTHTRDVIWPSERGTIQLERVTCYDTLGEVISRYVPVEFDPNGSSEERLFWLAFARRRIDKLLTRAYKSTDFAVNGDLLAWTRFVEVLSQKHTVD